MGHFLKEISGLYQDVSSTTLLAGLGGGEQKMADLFGSHLTYRLQGVLISFL